MIHLSAIESHCLIMCFFLFFLNENYIKKRVRDPDNCALRLIQKLLILYCFSDAFVNVDVYQSDQHGKRK